MAKPSLVYLKPGSRFYQIVGEVDPATGRRKDYSSKTTIKELAIARAYKDRTKNFEARYLGIKHSVDWTVNQLLDWATAGIWANSPRLHEMPSLQKWLRLLLGEENAAALSVDRLEKFRQERFLLDVTKSTINRELTMLKSAYNAAIKSGHLHENPVTKIKFFDEREFRRTVYLTAQEETLLLNECARVSPDLLDMVIFAVRSGMRQGEIRKLTWGDVDLENGLMKTTSKKGNRTTIRYVPIAEDVRDVLARRPHYGKTVFAHPDGKNFSKHCCAKSTYQAICRRLTLQNPKFEDFTFHDLRHTFASQFLMKGGSLRALALIMGHSTTVMTERYGHLAKEHVAVQMNLLPRVRFQVPQNNGGFTAVDSDSVAETLKVVD